jgi:hypothetical protein
MRVSAIMRVSLYSNRLDLLIRSLLALGATHQDLAKVITSRVARAS